MRKKVVVILLAVVALFCFCAGCNLSDLQQFIDNNNKKLDTPINIRVDDDGVLRWDSVENASSYIIVINEKEYERTTIACDLNKILKEDGKYEIYIKAKSNDVGYKDSELSQAFIYNYNGGAEEQTGLFSDFDDIYTSNAYLGYGYDVIGSSYIDSRQVKANYPIFDEEKLVGKNLKMIKEIKSVYSSITGESLNEYQENFEAEVGLKVNMKKVFSGSISTKFKQTSKDTLSVLFVECISMINCYQLILQCDAQEYREMLTEAFKRDLMTMDIDELFRAYGTHVLTSVVMGGRLNFNYTFTSEEYVDLSELGVSVGLSMKNCIDAGIDVEMQIENEAKKMSCQKATTNSVLGGASIELNSEKQVFSNYQTWYNSVLDNPALVDVRDVNSLYPIWDLLGNTPEEEARKQEIKNTFETYAENTYGELLSYYDVQPADYEKIIAKQDSITKEGVWYKEEKTNSKGKIVEENLAGYEVEIPVILARIAKEGKLGLKVDANFTVKVKSMGDATGTAIINLIVGEFDQEVCRVSKKGGGYILGIIQDGKWGTNTSTFSQVYPVKYGDKINIGYKYSMESNKTNSDVKTSLYYKCDKITYSFCLR